MFLWLWLCTATFSSAAALNCAIELDGKSDEYNQTSAHCDEGCLTCSFNLISDCFQYGTVECLENVHCYVSVYSPDACLFGAMYKTIIDGSKASYLSVQSNVGDSSLVWQRSEIYAPGNGHNFAFFSSRSMNVINTQFYAEDSGNVDIAIFDGGKSMNVFASTAERLVVTLAFGSWLCDDYYESRIECPATGECEFYSSTGTQLFDNVVDLILYESTTMQIDCGYHYPNRCDGVVLHCDGQRDGCQMQYDGVGWNCGGNLTLIENQNDTTKWHCPVLTTTTTPTTTDYDSSNTNQKLAYIFFAVVLGAVCAL